MTHDEFLVLWEAATAGWHGAKARDAMLGLTYATSDGHISADSIEWAAYHARAAGRAALRAIQAIDTDFESLQKWEPREQ